MKGTIGNKEQGSRNNQQGCRLIANIFFACIAIFLFPVIVSAVNFSEISDTPPTGFVKDSAGMLGDTAPLEAKLQQFETATSAEIAVVTIDALPPDHTLETFATELFEKWGIGKAKNDNGLLLLIARDDRAFRIETGYGLEGTIPDLLAAQITEKFLVPRFREGNFTAGVNGTIDALQKVIAGNVAEVMAESTNPEGSEFGFFYLIVSLFFLNVGLPLLFKAVLFLGALSIAWSLGGIFGIVLYLIALAIVAIFFSAKGNFPTRNDWGSGSWGGGGFSGGSGGFGGFGGGMSGGGGFSGKW